MPTILEKNNVAVNGDSLIIKYKGKTYSLAFKDISKRLAKASKTVRENFVLSPSGYGIHWPEVDEDLSIGGLLKTKAQK